MKFNIFLKVVDSYLAHFYKNYYKKDKNLKYCWNSIKKRWKI